MGLQGPIFLIKKQPLPDMKKVLLIIAAAIFACASSCDKPVKPEQPQTHTLSVSPESVSVSFEKSVQILTVTADCDWGVTSDDREWISVSPSGGASGTTDVKVTISENKGQAARESGVTFRFGDGVKTVAIRQHYKVDAASISDAGFLKALLAAYDSDKDGILSTVEASGVKKIEASGYGIKQMPELNTMFKDITYLDCSNNALTSLDISNLYKLEYLDCTGNPALKVVNVWSGFKTREGFKFPEGVELKEPEIPTPAGFTLVWNDEFEAEPASSGKWRFEDWRPGYVNNELQRYVANGRLDGKKTAFVENGVLNIVAMQHNGQVISARMNTTKSWKYGYFEARIRLPKGKGTWPAFWMMPDDQSKGWPTCGEIDIMEEVGVNPNYTSSSIHCKAYNHPNNTQKTKERYTKNAESEFHTYALEWDADGMKFYVDGVHDSSTLTFKNDGKGDQSTWPFDKPFYITLNLAWGGDWGGWNGVDNSALPCTMQVDYVRVFQKN